MPQMVYSYAREVRSPLLTSRGTSSSTIKRMPFARAAGLDNSIGWTSDEPHDNRTRHICFAFLRNFRETIKKIRRLIATLSAESGLPCHIDSCNHRAVRSGYTSAAVDVADITTKLRDRTAVCTAALPGISVICVS